MITVSTASYLVGFLSGPPGPAEPPQSSQRSDDAQSASPAGLFSAIGQRLQPEWLRQMRDTRAQERSLHDALGRLGALSDHLLTDIGYFADGTLIEQTPDAVHTVPPPGQAPQEAVALPQQDLVADPDHPLAA